MPEQEQVVADALHSGKEAMERVSQVIESLNKGLEFAKGKYLAVPYLPETPKVFYYWQARRRTRPARAAIEDFVVQLSALDLERTGEFRLGLASRQSVDDIFGARSVEFFLSEGLFLEGELSKSRISANVGLSRIKRALRALDGSPE